MNIQFIHARQILDSRGNPTVETEVHLDTGVWGRASVPSGASTGIHEAVELRDNDEHTYGGKGVLKAVNFVNTEIFQAVKGLDVMNLKAIDEKMIALDGTPNKARLGANAILSVSLASAYAAAIGLRTPLYNYIGQISGTSPSDYKLPVPMMNIINGGKHGGWGADIQEFMIIPKGAKNFAHAIQMGSEIFHALGDVLSENGYPTTVGDEGGYAPILKKGNKEAFDLMSTAITKAGYSLGTDVFFGLDAASSEFFHDGEYILQSEKRNLSVQELIAYWKTLCSTYPITSLEDPLQQEDWAGWTEMTTQLGDKIQIVGDDLFVTNTEFLKKGIQNKSANAILVKVNQIGTLTETIAAVKMAKEANFNAIVSHRSGETEDTTIAHIVVGLGTGQIKTGSLSRTDRVSKYNELLRIEETIKR